MYSFLKKNAAYSTNGQLSSRRDSDFATNIAYEERGHYPNGTNTSASMMPRVNLFQDNNDANRSQGGILNSNHSIYTFANKQKDSQTPRRTP